jgi:hypothetical protein
MVAMRMAAAEGVGCEPQQEAGREPSFLAARHPPVGGGGVMSGGGAGSGKSMMGGWHSDGVRVSTCTWGGCGLCVCLSRYLGGRGGEGRGLVLAGLARLGPSTVLWGRGSSFDGVRVQ